MRKRLLSLLLLSSLLAAAALAAGGSASALPKIPKGVHIPKGIKIPQVKSVKYPVTIDVAGYIDFTWNYDAREKCVPAYAKTVSEELSFELGRPIETAASIVGGTVGTIPVTGGTVFHKSEVGGYQVSKTCPPSPEQPRGPSNPEPVCGSGRGKLQVWLHPRPLAEESDDAGEFLAPLGRGVNLILVRKGGADQKKTCFENRPRIETVKADPFGYNVDTMPTNPSGLVLPADSTGSDFWKLGPGETLNRSIGIGGGCGGASAKATASAIPSTIKSCRFSGRVILTVKRLR